MAQIFRFEDANGNVRLDLNNPNGWCLAQGLNVGKRPKIKTYMKSDDANGAVLVNVTLDITQMSVPLHLMPVRPTGQTEAQLAVTMKALIDAMVVEADRVTNIIRHQPDDWPTYYLYDTYTFDLDSVFKGEAIPSPAKIKQSGRPYILTIDREPDARVGGVHV